MDLMFVLGAIIALVLGVGTIFIVRPRMEV